MVVVHTELEVYREAFEAAMTVYEASKAFPKQENYALTDQLRRSSRSVCANIAEAWRKRRYENAFAAKLSDAESEAAETQVWIEFAVRCGYLPAETGRQLFTTYHRIIGALVGMIHHRESWVLREDNEDYVTDAEADFLTLSPTHPLT
jgi:four helix bundle protein